MLHTQLGVVKDKDKVYSGRHRCNSSLLLWERHENMPAKSREPSCTPQQVLRPHRHDVPIGTSNLIEVTHYIFSWESWLNLEKVFVSFIDMHAPHTCRVTTVSALPFPLRTAVHAQINMEIIKRIIIIWTVACPSTTTLDVIIGPFVKMWMTQCNREQKIPIWPVAINVSLRPYSACTRRWHYRQVQANTTGASCFNELFFLRLKQTTRSTHHQVLSINSSRTGSASQRRNKLSHYFLILWTKLPTINSLQESIMLSICLFRQPKKRTWQCLKWRVTSHQRPGIKPTYSQNKK